MSNSGGKFSRDKGAKAEREAASLWRLAGFPARRRLSQYQERCGADLEGTDPYLVQVKVGKNPNVWEALEEAVKEAKDGQIPVAMIKKDRKQWIVVIKWNDFTNLHDRERN